MPIIWPLWIAGTAAYTYYRKDEITGAVVEVSKEAFDYLASEGATVLTEEVGALLMQLGDSFTNIDWDAVGEAVGKAASAVIHATADVGSGIAKNIIPDIIEGAEIGYTKIAEKLEGKGTTFVGGFTVAFLVVMTIIYTYSVVRQGR